MDRQTLRDWVIQFNEQGPEGLINIPSPGAPAKLTTEHKAFLARIVEEGPIDAVLIDNQRADQSAELQQCMPITPVLSLFRGGGGSTARSRSDWPI